MDKKVSGGGVSKKAMRRSPTSRNERRAAIRAKLNIPPCTCPTCVAKGKHAADD